MRSTVRDIVAGSSHEHRKAAENLPLPNECVVHESGGEIVQFSSPSSANPFPITSCVWFGNVQPVAWQIAMTATSTDEVRSPAICAADAAVSDSAFCSTVARGIVAPAAAAFAATTASGNQSHPQSPNVRSSALTFMSPG